MCVFDQDRTCTLKKKKNGNVVSRVLEPKIVRNLCAK